MTDLGRAPLGAPPESLRRLHKEYSDELKYLRGQRRNIQGDLNYQGEKTNTLMGNVLMYDPVRVLAGWAGYDHLIPRDTSHPDHIKYL